MKSTRIWTLAVAALLLVLQPARCLHAAPAAGCPTHAASHDCCSGHEAPAGNTAAGSACCTGASLIQPTSPGATAPNFTSISIAAQSSSTDAAPPAPTRATAHAHDVGSPPLPFHPDAHGLRAPPLSA